MRDELGRFISRAKAERKRKREEKKAAELATEKEAEKERQAAEHKRKEEEERKRKEEEERKRTRPPIPQIFGKYRGQILIPITNAISTRIQEASELIKQVTDRGFQATDISEIGYDYYQLIAEMEKMDPHDIYTLFMSP